MTQSAVAMRATAGQAGSPVLALEPEPRRVLQGTALDNALEVAADFIDLKSPYMARHSRRCAALSADAARLVGLPDEAIAMLQRAALVHHCDDQRDHKYNSPFHCNLPLLKV